MGCQFYVLQTPAVVFYAQLFGSDMTPQGKIFETQIDQLPFLVPESICANGLMLAGFGGLAAKSAFEANGLAANRVSFGNKQEVSIVDAGMIAKMAAEKIKLGDLPPLTPLYLADPHLGPKKT